MYINFGKEKNMDNQTCTNTQDEITLADVIRMFRGKAKILICVFLVAGHHIFNSNLGPSVKAGSLPQILYIGIRLEFPVITSRKAVKGIYIFFVSLFSIV